MDGAIAARLTRAVPFLARCALVPSRARSHDDLEPLGAAGGRLIMDHHLHLLLRLSKRAALGVAIMLTASALGACSSSSSTSGDDPCGALAKQCPYCTDPGLQSTCNNAVASHDPASCRDGLNDKDVQANCVAHSTPADSGSGGGSDTSTGIDSNIPVDGSGGDTSSPCDELAKLCPHCTDPGLKSTCDLDVASKDPASCQNGLDDHDIQTNCHP
jgi:hypothetical protein